MESVFEIIVDFAAILSLLGSSNSRSARSWP